MVAGLQIGGWVSLTYVALVLGYNLAFWLAWNGQCSLWNWISLLYQHRAWKYVPMRQLVCDTGSIQYTLKKKEFSHSGHSVLFIYWTVVSTDKLTDCAPGLFPLQKERFFFPFSCLRFTTGSQHSLVSVWQRHPGFAATPLPLQPHSSNNRAQFNRWTTIENVAGRSST